MPLHFMAEHPLPITDRHSHLGQFRFTQGYLGPIFTSSNPRIVTISDVIHKGEMGEKK